MRIKPRLMLGSIVTIMMISCAAPYKSMDPSILNYPTQLETDQLTIKYNTNILDEANTRKLGRQANNLRLSFAALQVENHSSKPIDFSQDVELKSSGQLINPLSTKKTFKLLKQHPLTYYLALINFAVVVDSDRGTYALSAINPFGIIYAVPNSIIALNANQNMKSELNQFDISRIVIKPYDTAYAFLCYRNQNNGELSIHSIKGDSVNCKRSKIANTHISSTGKTYTIDSNLYYHPENGSSFELYLTGLTKMLESSNTIEDLRLAESTYKNGNAKFVGIRAKHKYGTNNNYYYKIGTWRYFYENGQLKEQINYNLEEKKNGPYQLYSENGELLKEAEFYFGREIHCNNCSLSYNPNRKKDMLYLKSGERIDCKILSSDIEFLYYQQKKKKSKLKKEDILKIEYGDQ